MLFAGVKVQKSICIKALRSVLESFHHLLHYITDHDSNLVGGIESGLSASVTRRQSSFVKWQFEANENIPTKKYKFLANLREKEMDVCSKPV